MLYINGTIFAWVREHVPGVATVSAVSAPSFKSKVSARKTTKIFVCLTLLFIVSFFMLVLSASELFGFYVLYAYFINHIGNPIVYFIYNAQFRQQVREIFCPS